MHKFRSPNTDFLQEMVTYNVAHQTPPLNLSAVPRSVLEKVVHHVAICSLMDETPPKVDVSVGPDEDYHHEIKGLAAYTARMAGVFYRDEEDAWYSVAVTTNGPNTFDINVAKLIDDTKCEWELLDMDSEKLQELSLDALSYLGIL